MRVYTEDEYAACLKDTIEVTVPGNPTRTCRAEEIGEREGQRLVLIVSPYNWGEAQQHYRLGLIDTDNVVYRLWYPMSAPKWAQRIFNTFFESPHALIRPIKRRSDA